MPESRPEAADPNPPAGAARLPVPGALAAGIAALLAAISCLLPWCTVDLSGLGGGMAKALEDATEATAPDMGELLSSMMSSMTLSGSATVNGINGWIGIATLVASIAVAVLAFGEPAGVLPFRRRSVLMANVGFSWIAAGLVIYGLSRLGGPLSVEHGLVLAAFGTVGAAVFTFHRFRAYGRLQQAGRQSQ